MAAFPERREAFPAKPEGGNMNRMEVQPPLPLPSQRPQRKTVPGNRARGCHASRDLYPLSPLALVLSGSSG